MNLRKQNKPRKASDTSDKIKKPWYKKYLPGKRTRSAVKSTVKNKTVQKSVLTAGTMLAVMPKDLLNDFADKIQETAENVYNMGD